MTNPPALSNYNTQALGSQNDALWHEVHRIFAGFEQTAFAKELRAVFENLHDEELLEALQKTRWTGRPGYPIKVMWRSIIASHILNIPTIQELIRTLHRNPFMAVMCGIYSDAEIPTRFSYYRFIKKLITHKDLIEKCMAKTIEVIQGRLPEFGEMIAVDSSAVPTYSNKYKKKLSDQDAGWGKKVGPGGEPDLWYGYKLHLVTDSKYEIPLIPIITAANASDSPLMIPVLIKNRTLLKHFEPNYVLADKGYDAVENHRAVVEDFKAIPIIDIRKLKRISKYVDIADETGQPYCAWEIPMVFWGYDKKQKRLKYRCPQACGKPGCTWLDKCSESSYGHVVKIKIRDDYRRFCQIPRHTDKWKKTYHKRVAVERVFSRLKKDGDGKIVNHRIRGLDKITLNCLLSVWVMQARSSL